MFAPDFLALQHYLPFVLMAMDAVHGRSCVGGLFWMLDMVLVRDFFVACYTLPSKAFSYGEPR
jgi:hypothetical protein